jgi:hypothetical protein
VVSQPHDIYGMECGRGGGGSLPPGVWKSWESVSSPWVTLGPDQICVDTTSNGWDMGAKTQRTWGTDVNYVVEFEFKTNKDSLAACEYGRTVSLS